jgi:hypothetical protein
MLLKDLIKKLEVLYSTYTDEYKEIWGEPEIMVDAFLFLSEGGIKYKGFSPDIVIDYSSDGVYPIISCAQTSKIN